MQRLGFSHFHPDFTCDFFRELDDRGRYSYEDFAQLCATAPSGPLTGVWMSHHIEPRVAFPQLYPVVVIDDGTDVFVRSLPGTERHLTMRLSREYDLELSGPLVVHWPGMSRLFDPSFHEHIRFPVPDRRHKRLRLLDGEWQRRDMLAFEGRVRPTAAERSGRRWWLRRFTTSLDRASLDQFVDVPPAPPAPAGRTRVLAGPAGPAVPDPVTPLSEALSYLLYPDAGVVWHAAARQAARLLAPAWQEVEADEYAQDRLECLALTVYALADETINAPAMVPVQAIRNALKQAVQQIADSDDGEPQKLKYRIMDALLWTDRTGAVPGDAVGRPSVHELYSRLIVPDWHIGQDRPYLPLGPSVMVALLPWLSDRLSRIDETGLRPAPEPAGTLTVNVSGKVWTAASVGTADTRKFVACPLCGPVQGATIIVDRAEVTLVCANRHRSHPKELSAPVVRLGLREALAHKGTHVDPAAAGPRTANIRGSFKVRHRVAYDLKLPERPTDQPADQAGPWCP